MEKLKIYADLVDEYINLRIVFNGVLCGRMILEAKDFIDFIDEIQLKLTGLRNVISGEPPSSEELKYYLEIDKEDTEKLANILRRSKDREGYDF